MINSCSKRFYEAVLLAACYYMSCNPLEISSTTPAPLALSPLSPPPLCPPEPPEKKERNFLKKHNLLTRPPRPRNIQKKEKENNTKKMKKGN